MKKSLSKIDKWVREEKENYKRWNHPGGKFLIEGAESCSEAELISILISSGVKGKSAEKIADEIIGRFGSFKGLAFQPLEKLEAIHGLGKVKIIRIAAAFEIARRIVKQVLQER